MPQEPPSRVERRLSAIFAADVAGYSRLMGLDEAGTARILREHRVVADALVAEHGGRIVKTTGDGILLEFPSVVDAVECAVAVQSVMSERNEGVPQDRRMLFRIGINLGDILIEGDDILGDGVNVAARLEGIAKPGGICISSSAYEQVRGKVDVEFADLGEQNLKNIARPVRAYAVKRNGLGLDKQNGAVPHAPSAPRLSIVVLPFANIGGDPEQEYFADGITESLTTDLSRIAGSFVIARNTAFTFKGKAVDVKQIGRELNIRYVFEGSVQRGGNRLRVNVQLIDAETGNHLWAERFDKPITDLFDMQDEIVSRLANALDTQLVVAEARRAEGALHPNSMDLYFQGRACWNKGFTREYLTQARGYFERALALDPGNIEALVGTAHVEIALAAGFLLSDDRIARLAVAETASIKALSIVPNHAAAHAALGIVQTLTNRAAQGIAECERALALDRNLASAHAFIGIAKCSLGRAEEAEAHILEALRISPRDILAYQWMMIAGNAKLLLNSEADAAAWLRRCLEANRNFPLVHFLLAAALALLGEPDQARAAAEAGSALNPGFTIRTYRTYAMSDNPTYLAGRERIFEGLRLAGVPEG
jgi:TolB-like protein/class 3 adenylate cyclase/Tfp pilus assembly protein PilF